METSAAKKRERKHKKHRRHSSSSPSSNQGEDQWQEAVPVDHHDDIPARTVIKGPTMPTPEDLQKLQTPSEPVEVALEPLDFDSFGSYRRENKTAVKKDKSRAEMEAILQERELNPSLRQQPAAQQTARVTTVGDAGLEWHRRAFERCKQQAKEEQRPLEEIVSERYGSMDKLMSLINDAEDLHHHHHHQHGSQRKRFLHPNERDDRHHRHDHRDSRHHHHHHHHRRHEETPSWKRATDDEEISTPKRAARVEEAEPESTVDEPQREEKQEEEELISEENLLELRKQLIRAELAGDDEMSDMLRNEVKHIDQLRGNQPQDASDEQQTSTEPKILVMTTIDRYGVEKPIHKAHEPGEQRQYGHASKGDRRKMKREVKKMRHNDKDPERQGLSLTDLVEMERHSTSNSMPVLPSSRNAPGTMTADRHILASTRHLTGWARIEALAQQRKRQQTFEQCWLCIENLSKSYIFGLLDQWFLCAPPQQSLVDGHCFLVPIQHTSSRFQLDDDALAELDTLKQQLTDLYREHYNQLPIFIETFKNPRLLPHLYIECIPVPIEQADQVPMYFRKALLESESMWSTNKKLLELNDYRSRTLKSVLPKGLPYFCVEFPVDRKRKESIHGYAHMIEERGQFPLYFGREIVGGLMQLDNPLLWMRPASKEPEEIVANKCRYLKELWKKNSTRLST